MFPYAQQKRKTMALIWQRQNSLSTDFLGTSDECYTFHGEAHIRLARKFFQDISRDRKQLLFIYGEQGMGKSRLAKQTARKLAGIVNGDKPLLSLFLINCERYKEKGRPELSDLQRDIAQKVAAVDESLSKTLARCESHDFSSRLSSFLVNRMFLFLFDGIIANFQTVISFMDNLVEYNSNVIIVATSAEYLSMTKQRKKVSTHTCSGLPPGDAVSLLQEVAGLVDELQVYQDEIVSLCHFNPFLIMRAGQQMSDEIFPYKPAEMRELLQESVMLAVSGGNVPEREDVFARELALTKQLTKSMGRNIGLVLEQSREQFTATDVAAGAKTQISDGKVKKSVLETLAHASVLSQENGFYSLRKTFEEFCDEQAANLDISRDEVVIEVYKELRETLGCVLSQQGLQKVFMIHSNEMKQIREFERMIPKDGHGNEALRFVSRGHFINACSSFLSNIPLGTQAVSEFKEKSFAHLYRINAQEKSKSLQAARGSDDSLFQQFWQLDVNDWKPESGHRDQSGPARGKREMMNGQRREHGEQIGGGRKSANNREENNFDRRRKGADKPCECQRRPNERGKGQGVDAVKHCHQTRHSGGGCGIDNGMGQLSGGQGEPKLGPDNNGTGRVEWSEYQKSGSRTENGTNYRQGTTHHHKEQEMSRARKVEPCEFQGAPDDIRRERRSSDRTEPSDISMRDRFGQVGQQHPFSHFSDFSSIKTSGELESDWESLTSQAPGVGDMSTRLDFRAIHPEPPPEGRYCPPPSTNIPVESSDPSESSPLRWYTTGPSQQSFHEWPEESQPEERAPFGEWSMENNPPSPHQMRHAPLE